MEYRCYIVGDAVTEPGALLRRLMHQPFPEAEERALAQQSLLFTRSEEAKGTNAYPMAVSLPNLQDPRHASLTLPNPSMPSVDITVQFAAISDPHELERVMLSHYHAASSAHGSGGGAFGRSLRRSFSSPSSSFQDFNSSEASSMAGGASGVALRAPPHAIVITFNPFSLCSFSKLRVEWVHSLRVLRQHQSQRVNAALQQQQQHQQLQRQSQRYNTSGILSAAPSVPASPLSPAYPLEAVENFPVVLLVATRMELMRDTMEATPSVHVPSSLDVAEVALALQAQAYVEVGTNWDDSLDALRVAVARACMGELATAPLVTYNTTYRARQNSVAHAIEAVHMDPYEGEDEEAEEERQGREGTVDERQADGSHSDVHLRSPCVEEAETRREQNHSITTQTHHSDKGTPLLHESHADGQQRQSGGDTEPPSGKGTIELERRHSVYSAHASVRTAIGPADSLYLTERAASDFNTSEIFTRSAHLSSLVGHAGRDGVQAAVTSASADPAAAAAAEDATGEPVMRGRELRRHLVSTLAPLVVPADVIVERDAATSAGAVKNSQPTADLQANTTAGTVAAGEQGDGGQHTPHGSKPRQEQHHAHRHPHRRSSAGEAAPGAEAHHSPQSTWTWRRHPRTGRVFYVYRASGRSQYECPEDYDGPPVEAKREEKADEKPLGAFIGSAQQQPSQQRGSASASVLDHEVSESARAADAAGATDAAGAEGGGGEAGESLNSWQQRQQLQLRRAQVPRLERQVHQLRLQAERLRAQSEANTQLKAKVAEMRAALDSAEQAFSARVAEENEELAKQILDATIAVEELAAVVEAPVLLNEAANASSSTPEDTTLSVGQHGQSRTAAAAAAERGLAKEVCRMDQHVTEALEALQTAVARRDREAEALSLLQRRRQRVAEATQAAEAELVTLHHAASQAEDALQPLRERLAAAQAEAAVLRSRVQAAELRRSAKAAERQAQLEVCVAQRLAAQQQAETLQRLRERHGRLLSAYQAALRACGLSARLPAAAVVEEHQRHRLNLEAATGRCAAALLRNAEALFLMQHSASTVESARQRLSDAQETQRRALVAALEAAEARRATAVQRYYCRAFLRGEDDEEGGADVAAADVHREVAEAAVEASAAALDGWHRYSCAVATPLLDRADSIVAELMFHIQREAAAAEVLRGSSDGSSYVFAEGRRVRSGAITPTTVDAVESMAARVFRTCQALKEACREPLTKFLQHQAAVDALAERDSSTVLLHTDAAPIKPNRDTTLLSGDTDAPHGECAAAVERVLWASCDGLVKRLKDLDERFVSAYVTRRQLLR